MATTTQGNEVLGVEAMRGSPQPEAEGSRYRFAAMAVGGIWGALAAASIWSPELISGTDQSRVPIAAFTDWFYALIATGRWCFWPSAEGPSIFPAQRGRRSPC